MAAAAANHSHRAGRLKQQNKKNKRSSASKRSLGRRQGGKVQSSSLPSGGPGGRKGLKSTTEHTSRQQARANRTNAARQRREASRKNVWNARRGVGVGAAPTSRALTSAPPRIVGIVSLSELEGPLEERVRRSLSSAAERALTSSGGIHGASSVTASYPVHARGGNPHVTLLTNAASFRPQYAKDGYGAADASVQGALDLCRVCDMVLFLIEGSSAVSVSSTGGSSVVGGGSHDARSVGATSVKTSNTTAHLDHLVGERGDRVLSAIRAQGLPTPVTVIVHREEREGVAVKDSPLGRHVGIGLEDATMDDDNDDDDDDIMEEDMLASLPGHSLATSRSMKSIKRSYLRKRSELKRYVARLAATEFGEAGNKVVEIDIPDNNGNDGHAAVEMAKDGGSLSLATAAGKSVSGVPKSQTSVAALVRTLCTMSASGPHWVADAPRPHLVTDGSAATPAVGYDASSCELRLTGYIRGNSPWNCNQLAHVPHLGTFAVKNVRLAGASASNEDSKEVLPPIVAAGRKVRRGATKKDANADMVDADNSGKEGELLAKSDPEERESLEMFASPDALEGEQNLIGFDDDDDDDEGGDRFDDGSDGVNDGDKPKNQEFQPGTSRPAGWSDYQSAWLDALDPDDAGDDAEDRGELAFALNKKSDDKKDPADALMDEDDEVNDEEKRALLARREKDARNDLQFPDEVDHEEETSARDRFARYRAIKSFRKSHWDPKENLPESYGAVYHFGSFRATQRDVLEDARGLEEIVQRRGWGAGVGAGDEDDMERDSDDEEEETTARACVPPGAYVCVTLEGVPSSAYARLSPDALVQAVSLLPHENKVSVLHMGLTTASDKSMESEMTTTPVKSKDALTFRCGWRTWRSRPIFSQHNLNSDKHKFERYAPSSSGGVGGATYFAGSVFGPVTYAPCPTMMFRETEGEEDPSAVIGDDGIDGEDDTGTRRRELVAHGSMLGADADRIVLKRIVLTGYPTRVHKRHATVKYMFYNPEDVKWFMPAGITTKHGLQGNIVQSVGDHGVMKCLFNAPIKQHDTVCLPLYKRVFPKFAPVDAAGSDAGDDDAEGGVDGNGEGSGAMGSVSKHFRVL